jgi:DNA-binding transcriptional ArsR family regulator
MKDGPNIARVAALVGDNARAEVLSALMADRALTATELATIADVTKQTISAHLAKLVDAGLLAVLQQGRHRYFRLADRDVAALLESLMGVAFRTGAVRLRGSPREPALRKARVCYDHLAGERGVQAYESMLAQQVFTLRRSALRLTPSGAAWFARIGIDVTALRSGRRALCRTCLDWGERRHHLAGALGTAMLRRMLALGWVKQARDSRVLTFLPPGELAFARLFART